MPRMTNVDADVIAQAVADIASVEPLFRLQEDMEKYMTAVNRIAETIGMTVPWGQSAQS